MGGKIVKNNRNMMGIEYLRILAMILIVAHHFSVHGGYEFSDTCTNSIIVDVFKLGGKIGVNIFVLITGYFSQSSKFKMKKVTNLIGVVTFYSIALGLVAYSVGELEMGKTVMVELAFPYLLGSGYWFVVIYLIMYLLTPFINAGINGVDKKYLNILIAVSLMLYCVFPAFVNPMLAPISKINGFGFSFVVWFIILYIIGGQLRNVKNKLCTNSLIMGLVAFLSGLLLAGTTVVNALKPELFEGSKLVETFYNAFSSFALNGFLPVIISVSLLLCFANLKLKPNRFMMHVASCTFAVYLIHDNGYISSYLWENICQTINMADTAGGKKFLLYAIVCTIAVFAVCVLIESVRRLILKIFIGIWKRLKN